jgi:hypothetical protein
MSGKTLPPERRSGTGPISLLSLDGVQTLSHEGTWSARLFTLVCVVVVGGLFIPAVGALNVALELKNIPQWPVLIPTWLGVPIAVWATVVLFRRDVRVAFQSRPVPDVAGSHQHGIAPKGGNYLK